MTILSLRDCGSQTLMTAAQLLASSRQGTAARPEEERNRPVVRHAVEPGARCNDDLVDASEVDGLRACLRLERFTSVRNCTMKSSFEEGRAVLRLWRSGRVSLLKRAADLMRVLQ